MARKYFGTDGIRGTVGKFPITADFVMKLGWAAGRVLAEETEGRRMVILGKDTRVSGYMFESALQAGLIASGVEVGLLGPMPTPAIAYLTRTFQARAGIVISASHNPYYDNGIKFFSADGFKLDDSIEERIEQMIDHEFVTETSENLGRAFRVTDAAGRYIEYCKSTLPRGLTLEGKKIVVDCAHGATYHIAPKVFEELGATIRVIGAEPNGRNINHERGATNTEALQSAVVDENADMGIAFDGDGDRVQFVDCHGNKVDGDQLLYIIATNMHAQGELTGVVGTLMSNFGFEKAILDKGIKFHRANVGDRYVIEAMKKFDYPLGGESSGHIICTQYGTTGDGIVSALQVLAALNHMNITLEEALSSLKSFPQVLINVPVAELVTNIENQDIQHAVQAAEKRLADKGRVLLRPSGTEPLIRVMVEGEDAGLVQQLANSIAERVRVALC
ncbi:MAG: phosphoglucosamine mutase [Pseudomonadales bacterium]